MKPPVATQWLRYRLESLWIGSYAAKLVAISGSADLPSATRLLRASDSDDEGAIKGKIDATIQHHQSAILISQPTETTDCFTPARRSEIMGRIRSEDTTPERIVRQLLHRSGFRFRLHRRDLPGKPDIVMAKYRTIINVHGCFWHGHTCREGRRPKSNLPYWNQKLDRNHQRDLRVQEQLAALGWRTLVVWECETKNLPCLELRLKKAITS